jgi:hypothetical protein
VDLLVLPQSVPGREILGAVLALEALFLLGLGVSSFVFLQQGDKAKRFAANITSVSVNNHKSAS